MTGRGIVIGVIIVWLTFGIIRLFLYKGSLLWMLWYLSTFSGLGLRAHSSNSVIQPNWMWIEEFVERGRNWFRVEWREEKKRKERGLGFKYWGVKLFLISPHFSPTVKRGHLQRSVQTWVKFQVDSELAKHNQQCYSLAHHGKIGEKFSEMMFSFSYL